MAIKLKVQETTPVKLKVNGADEVRLKVSDGVPIYPNPYEGAYEVTPTESEQTLSANGLMMTDDVTVHAIDSEYVGSEVPRRSSSDLTSSGATVSVPSGFYEENASKDIPTGTVVPASGIVAIDATLTASDNKLSLYKESRNAPFVSTPGYVESGTMGVTKITLTADVPTHSSSDLTVSGNTVTAPSGYYGSNASASVQSGSATTPTTSITANPTISVSSSGLITASVSGSQSVTPTVSEGYVTEGTAGTVSVGGSNTSQLTTQSGTTITPTESEQTAVGANKYTTGAVKVGAISSTYVGSGIDRKSSSDLTASGKTVTAPAGYYENDATKSVSNGMIGNPNVTRSKDEDYFYETISYPNFVEGWVTSAPTLQTHFTLEDKSVTPSTTAQTVTPTGNSYYLDSVTVDAMPTGSATPAASISGSSASKVIGNGTITLSKTIANTPQVTAGYVGSGTQGNTSVELSASITTKGATTYHPSTSNQTIASMTYLTGTQTINAVTHNLLAENIKSGVTLKIGDSSDDDCVASVLGTYSGGTPSLQAKTNIDPTTSSQTITADNGYDGLSSVQINAMPSGTEGTPTATKGTVTNHSVTVTPNVTNSAGYISGGTHSGTAVSVSASELVSGSETKTENGTYDVTNLAELVVSVSGSSTSKNTQVVQGTTRTNASSMTAVGAELTVSKTGTYDIYWSGFRSNTSSSYTWATQLYIDGTAHGSANTTWTNNVQNNHLTSVSLTANQKLRVYGRNTRGTSYYIYAPMLLIIEN